ncbi:MAG: PKD domain-containing protein [Planctomycetota bacterium]|jgi:PKD repeat protein
MGTTTNVAFRALGASAAVIFFAACAQEQQPFEPDARANSPQAAGAEVRVARVIEPDQLGVANPAGLAFSPDAGTLLLVTRTPGTPPGSATDIELITLAEDRAGTVRIAAGVTDPVNMAFDGNANRLLIFQSSNSQLIEIPARADGSLDPQTLRRIDARNLGLENPQGMTVDPASGRIFILDAARPRILGVEPHPQLGFERPIVSEIDLAWAGSSSLRGLALDPTDGHLHVLDPAAQALHELTETGQIVATRDLSGFEFRNTQGMTFGPSGDSTDDPFEMSLYIADRGLGRGAGSSFAESGHITELSFDPPAAAPAALFAPEVSSLVQTINTWQFNPPSPDPAGITYLGHLGHLLISDSEVNEMSIFQDVNLFEIELDGNLLETGNTTIHLSNKEPTGVTWNPANNHIFISNDDRDKIYEMAAGPDGIYGTADDIVTSFDTGAFGSGDPEGVTFDSSQGVLFIADGVDREVYRVSPGSNGVFDGTGGSGDDVVTSFDTNRLGLDDPEGIAWDSDFGHLYIVGKPANRVFHVTSTGQLLRTIDISAANADKPAGLAYAPSSVNPGQMNLYIVDRRVDNNSNSRENDGQAYEVSFSSSSGNALPRVTITAPADGSSYTEGDPITFSGTASDPEDGDLTASLTWTSSKDGTIGSGGSFTTSTLSPGTHTITAFVTDSGGLEGSDVITETVNVEGLNTLEVRVAAATDDAEEAASGSVRLSSSDLELVFDGSDQTVSMRFNGIAIPPGATIFSAYIQFQADESHSVATSLTLQAEATDNAATFVDADWNVSSRSRTAASVAWSPAPWETAGEAGEVQRTPDISSLIQEIVNRPGWSSGNSLAIIVTGTGERVAESYNGVSSAAPLIHVDYFVGSSTAPTAGFTWAATDLTVDFTDTSNDPNGTVVGWSWDFGDGATSTQQNPSHTYAAAGDYTVTLTVTDNDGETGTATQTASVSASNQAPTASFTWAATDLTVDFTDTSSDADGTIAGWSWDFGDGATSTLQNPSHTYAAAGDYTVTLTVTDNDGATGTATQTASVSTSSQAPTASFTHSCADLDCSFTDTSTDPDGTVAGWSWDFGDGATSTLQNPSHTYAAEANYAVTLTVTDNDGLTGTTTQTVSVALRTGAVIHITSTSSGTVGGVAFKDEDILTYDGDTDTWSVYFDGSDVGLDGSNSRDVRAFHLLANGDLLLSIHGQATLPDVGNVEPSDILRFSGSTGPTTSGTFSLYLRGADVGLAGEEIDAIGFAPDGRLVISADGSFSVPGASGKDEDLIALDPGGASWSLYFDGSNVGLADSSDEDVTGVWIDDITGDIYLTTKRAFSVPGVSGDESAIFVCRPDALGSPTSCSFASYWAGSAHGLTKNVAGIHIGK